MACFVELVDFESTSLLGGWVCHSPIRTGLLRIQLPLSLSLSLSLRAFAGSTNIPIGTLVQGGDVTADGALALRQLLLHTLSEDVQAVDVCLICRTGARSSVACAALSQRLSEGPALDVGVGGDRHLRVLNVVGGLRAWSEKVDPRIHV